MQRNNQQQQPRAPAQGPRFTGLEANRVSETYIFGPQALAYLTQRFQHLVGNPVKWNVRAEKRHPHPYNAWMRKHANAAIKEGKCGEDAMSFDVGGHGMRTDETTHPNGQSWSTTTYTSLPITGFDDELRHAQWKENYARKGKVWPMLNSCNCLADGEYVCKCMLGGLRKVDVVQFLTSHDSAYYPNVIRSMEQEMIRRKNLISYYAFHDYHSCVRDGNMSGTTFDNESRFTVSVEDGAYRVKVQVEGNPFTYEHGIINTQGHDQLSKDTWIRYDAASNSSIIHNIQMRLNTGAGYDYVVVRAQAFAGKHQYASEMKYFAEQPTHPVGEILEEMEMFGDILFEEWKSKVLSKTRAVTGQTINFVKELWNLRKKLISEKKNLTVESLDGRAFRIRLFRQKTTPVGFEFTVYTSWDVRESLVRLALKELAGKSEDSDVIRVTRIVLRKAIDNLDEDGAASTVTNYVADSVAYAAYLNAKVLLPVLRYLDHDADRTLVKQMLKGKTLIWQYFKEGPMYYFIKFVCALALIYIGWYFYEWGVIYGAQAADEVFGNPEQQVPVLTMMFVAMIVTVLAEANAVVNRCTRNWLKGTCVTVKDRLNIQQQMGRTDAKWKFRNPDWDIRGLCGEEAAEKLGCSKHGKIEAGQIGPILRGEEYYTPTVKHNCKCNIMAASIRATSNWVRPDAKIVKDWSYNTLRKVFGELTQGIASEGGIVVNYDNWLSKYPEAYREKIRKSMNKIDLYEHAYEYDSFPKKELQVSEVPHDFKDTDLNTVKERQISGPSDDKKIAANALINLLEKIADKSVKGYCGGKNWETICGCLNSFEDSIPNPIWLCADGSGFDMTQTTMLQEEFNMHFEKMLDTGLIDYGALGSKEHTMKALLQSLILKVNVNRGDASYQAEGRASGDGWTTFGNTILMLSYWRFVMFKAGIKENDYNLLVKGDDVIICLNEQRKPYLEYWVKQLFVMKNENKKHGLGQICKFLKWGHIEDMDFLSCDFFINNQGRIRMVCKGHRTIQKGPWSLHITTGDQMLQEKSASYLFAKGEAMEHWGGDLPFYGAYARMMKRLGKKGIWADYNMYTDEGRQWHKTDDRESFLSWLNYMHGITQQEVEEVEELMNRANDPLQTITHTVFDKLYERLH